MHSTQEEWRDIPGYEGLYEASNIGRIRSLDCIRTRQGDKRISSYKIKGKLLNPSSPNEYMQYYTVRLLNKSGKVKQEVVHRLVALAFISNPTPWREYVNHKDGNKLNNHVENLEWCTAQENAIHAVETGLNKLTGSNNVNAKKIIDTEYGIIYNTIGEAEEAYYPKYYSGQISKMLNGKIPNETNLRFAV